MDQLTSIAAAAAASDPALTTRLVSLLPILDAFNYRHRNQHSASHWWSTFKLLRHGAHSLITDLRRHQSLIQQLQTEKKSTAAKAKSRTSRKLLLARVALLRDHTVPKAYICLSQLVADNQHAALGLLLLSALARVNSVLIAMLPMQDETTHERPQPLEDSKLAHPPDALNNQFAPPRKQHITAADGDADKGVTISREHILEPKTKPKIPLVSDSLQEDKDALQKKRALPGTEKLHHKLKKSKLKKKNKGDELSNLFGSL